MRALHLLILLTACTDQLVDPGGDAALEAATDAGASCEAGETPCGTTCVDLMTTSTHCGSCGTDCAGARCAGGTCLPLVLASALDGPALMAIDGSNVIFVPTTLDSIEVVPKNGSTQAMPIKTGVSKITKLMAANATVVYSVGDQVFSLADTGGAASPVITDTNLMDWTTDGTNVFWLSSANQVTLMKASVAGANPTGIGNHLWTNGVAASGYLGANGTRVVWGLDGPAGYPRPFGLWSELYDGSSSVPICQGTSQLDTTALGSVWVDGAYAYTTIGTVMNLTRVPIAVTGCNEATINVSNTYDEVSSVAVDGTFVYWNTQTATNAVLRRPLDLSQAAATWLTNAVAVTALAGEPGFVYVGDQGAGTITRYPTP